EAMRSMPPMVRSLLRVIGEYSDAGPTPIRFECMSLVCRIVKVTTFCCSAAGSCPPTVPVRGSSCVGLSALDLDVGISISFCCSGSFRKCGLVIVAQPERLAEAQQHGKEGEQADADEENGDRNNRRLHPLLCHAGNGRERSAAQVANCPPVLPKRND